MPAYTWHALRQSVGTMWPAGGLCGQVPYSTYYVDSQPLVAVCGWSRVETETASADGALIWNKLPEYIFVRFETRTQWTIPGIDQENVFPVSVQSGMWFLDAGRANPQLKVTRYQFPIAPDFADTFYGAQGEVQ